MATNWFWKCDAQSWPVCWLFLLFPRWNFQIKLFYFRYRPALYRDLRGLSAFIWDGPAISRMTWTYEWYRDGQLVKETIRS